MTVVGVLCALSVLCTAQRLGSSQAVLRWIGPIATFLWVLERGWPVKLAAPLCVMLWQSGLSCHLRSRRLRALQEAAEEPVQAMFEQASLFGSAEHCALAALPACSAALRPIWQRALADWLRGGASEESFARAGGVANLPLLVRLARALALSRHTGTPLSRHLAVLLEDASEERRRQREREQEAMPFFVITLLMASALMALALWNVRSSAGPEQSLALAAMATAGLATYAAARIVP